MNTPITQNQLLQKVPEITIYFWIVKILTTAMGESTSDYLVKIMNPMIAVALGFILFAIALWLQFSKKIYCLGLLACSRHGCGLWNNGC